MANYYGARIIFPESALEIEEIKKAYEESSIEDEEICEGIVYADSYEARWGSFEELESALKKHNVPFDRYTDSDAGEQAIMVRSREDEEYVLSLSCDRGEPFIEIDELTAVLNSDASPEEILQMIKNLVEVRNPPVKDIEDYVTCYEGNITNSAPLKWVIDKNTILYVRHLNNNEIRYQRVTNDVLGMVYKAKSVEFNGMHTFFTHDEKQFWINENALFPHECFEKEHQEEEAMP
jgi:hypothetical protein